MAPSGTRQARGWEGGFRSQCPGETSRCHSTPPEPAHAQLLSLHPSSSSMLPLQRLQHTRPLLLFPPNLSFCLNSLVQHMFAECLLWASCRSWRGDSAATGSQAAAPASLCLSSWQHVEPGHPPAPLASPRHRPRSARCPHFLTEEEKMNCLSEAFEGICLCGMGQKTGRLSVQEALHCLPP